jgi:hypothetical protein
MKNLIDKIIIGLFSKQIEKNAQKKFIEIKQLIDERERLRESQEFPEGSKVISIGNEPGKMLVGVIKEWVPVSLAKNLSPLIVTKSGKEYISFGTLYKWSATKEAAFNKLTWDERHEVATHYYSIDKKDVARMNTEEYISRNSLVKLEKEEN